MHAKRCLWFGTVWALTVGWGLGLLGACGSPGVDCAFSSLGFFDFVGNPKHKILNTKA